MHPVQRVGISLFVAAIIFPVWGAHAQDFAVTKPVLEQESEPVPLELLAIEALPDTSHLAAALADNETRIETLLTLVAIERLLEFSTPGAAANPEALQARFRDERAWLDRLTLRYNHVPIRGSQLDPSAWFVLDELAHHELVPGLPVSPLGPGDPSMMRQLFDHSDERLSAAVLPEVLQRTEMHSTTVWTNVLETAAINQPLHIVLSGIYGNWLHRWVNADQPVVSGEADPDGVIAEAVRQLHALTVPLMVAGPADKSLLIRLRFGLLTAIPVLEDVQARDAGYMLVLANAVDGLQDGEYLAFTESLLSVVSDLLLNEQALPEMVGPPEFDLFERLTTVVEAPVETAPEMPENDLDPLIQSVIPIFLSDFLPRLSSSFAGSFSEVDPQINASLAAVFDVVQYLQNNPGPHERTRLDEMRQNMGDAVAQLVLQIPDMSYYFDQPVRRQIAEEVDVCISIAASKNQIGSVGFNRDQFDSCVSTLVEMSRTLVIREELSGDSFGPFGSEQLRRELVMPPWQRINFALGYMHDRFPTGCDLPTTPLPNPLEWAGLATMITWFARQAPVFFQTPENEALVLVLRQQGLDLLKGMMQQVDCISGQGAGVNDPVRRSLANYRQALNDLVIGIRQAELDFRAERLKPGADAALHSDASQRTAYRTEGLIIGPCNPNAVCEMSAPLEATRALIGLFPEPYLIADQTGLGNIEICYQNMEWVNRRAVPVRPEDPHVANYYGHLSFELVGRYLESGSARDIFGSTIVSPDEYHYLFAAATDEVREDNCPVEWIGSRIVTTLDDSDNFRVVPNRLTYLASARKKPSEVIEANWSKGAEWRDWFVTGLGVTQHKYPVDQTIAGRVNQHLQTLYQAQQSMIYAALLRPQPRGTSGDAMESLLDLQEELTARKALVRAYLNLFYPDSMMDSDDIRSALEGYGSLLDTATLMRFRESNTAVSSINEAGIRRIEQFQADWNRQPESVRRSGSIAGSVAHAIIRLNALYLEFFVQPSENKDSRDGVIEPFGLGG